MFGHVLGALLPSHHGVGSARHILSEASEEKNRRQGDTGRQGGMFVPAPTAVDV